MEKGSGCLGVGAGESWGGGRRGRGEVAAAAVASQGAAHLWEDPEHRAATMETPWLGKPMATPTSTWKPPPPAHGNARSAVSTRTTGGPPPRTAVCGDTQGQGGTRRDTPGGQNTALSIAGCAGVSAQQELLLELHTGHNGRW